MSDDSLHRRHERSDALRSQKTAGILQKEGIDTQRDKFLRFTGVVFVGVDGTIGIDKASHYIEAAAFCSSDRNLQVSHIVERVVRCVITHAVSDEALAANSTTSSAKNSKVNRLWPRV